MNKPLSLGEHQALRWWAASKIPAVKVAVYRQQNQENYAALGVSGPIDPDSEWGRMAHAARCAPDPRDVYWEAQRDKAVAARQREDEAWEARMAAFALEWEVCEGIRDGMPPSWAPPQWEF
jgi:biotin carboxylase